VTNVKAIQTRINRRLKEINKGYEVRNLRRLPDGEYWFDLAMTFNPKDLARVNRVFQDVIGAVRKSRAPRVQAKFYLSSRTYQQLRKRAAERGVPQSTLVEEALQSTLA
jgi:hypothetical protein